MRLYLDVLKWRCGGDKKNKLGKGPTKLLNKQGYMCCLGQFSEQVAPEIDIKGKSFPDHCQHTKNNILVKKQNSDVYCATFGEYWDTPLSSDCGEINDDDKTTVKEKIDLLRKRLKRNGHELIVKNLSKI